MPREIDRSEDKLELADHGRPLKKENHCHGSLVVLIHFFLLSSECLTQKLGKNYFLYHQCFLNKDAQALVHKTILNKWTVTWNLMGKNGLKKSNQSIIFYDECVFDLVNVPKDDL